MSKLLLLIAISAFGFSIANGQTTKQSSSESLGGKPVVIRFSNNPVPPDPLDALRTGKVIYVKSSSLLVSSSVLEEKLQKRREYQQLGLVITRDFYAADVVLELHHDVLTKYVYSAIDPKTDTVVASGKLSSLGGTVAGKVAKRFLKQMVQARSATPGP